MSSELHSHFFMPREIVPGTCCLGACGDEKNLSCWRIVLQFLGCLVALSLFTMQTALLVPPPALTLKNSSTCSQSVVWILYDSQNKEQIFP